MVGQVASGSARGCLAPFNTQFGQFIKVFPIRKPGPLPQGPQKFIGWPVVVDRHVVIDQIRRRIDVPLPGEYAYLRCAQLEPFALPFGVIQIAAAKAEFTNMKASRRLDRNRAEEPEEIEHLLARSRCRERAPAP